MEVGYALSYVFGLAARLAGFLLLIGAIIFVVGKGRKSSQLVKVGRRMLLSGAALVAISLLYVVLLFTLAY